MSLYNEANKLYKELKYAEAYDILIEEMKVEMIKEQDKDYQKELSKNIKHLSSNNGKEAMLKEAMHIGIIPTTNADYDKDDFKLNCFNGVVDLKNGKLVSRVVKKLAAKIIENLDEESLQ